MADQFHDRVHTIMTTKVFSLRPTDSVRTAIRLLLDNGISGAPVVEDGTGKLLGLITEYDLILAVHHVGWGLDVRQIMKTDILTVKSDAPIAEITDLMITQKIRRVLVVNDEGQPVGIVARRDIIAAYYDDGPQAQPGA